MLSQNPHSPNRTVPISFAPRGYLPTDKQERVNPNVEQYICGEVLAITVACIVGKEWVVDVPWVPLLCAVLFVLRFDLLEGVRVR